MLVSSTVKWHQLQATKSNTLSLHGVAWPWSPCWQDVHAGLHQASAQDPSCWRTTITGALQCWCGQDRNIHCTGHHSAEDEGRGHPQHLRVDHWHEKKKSVNGTNWGQSCSLTYQSLIKQINTVADLITSFLLLFLLPVLIPSSLLSLSTLPLHSSIFSFSSLSISFFFYSLSPSPLSSSPLSLPTGPVCVHPWCTTRVYCVWWHIHSSGEDQKCHGVITEGLRSQEWLSETVWGKTTPTCTCTCIPLCVSVV